MRGNTLANRCLAMVCAVLLGATSLHAQGGTESTRLKEQREELARIKREREELQRKHSALQNKVHNLAEEVSIINKQHDATKRAVRSLDKQLTYINSEISTSTRELKRAQAEALSKRNALENRLSEIYKRGALYTPQVLLQGGIL